MSDLSFEGPLDDMDGNSLIDPYMDCLHQMAERAPAEGRGILVESWPFDNRWRLSFSDRVKVGEIAKFDHKGPVSGIAPGE